MKSIFWGAVIIAIGLVRGDSVFRGDFVAISIFFDALGVFFIIRGLVSIYRAKQQDAAVSPAGPPPPAARRGFANGPRGGTRLTRERTTPGPGKSGNRGRCRAGVRAKRARAPPPALKAAA